MAPTLVQPQDFLGFAYAVLLAFGGILGAARRGSVVSLLMGVGSGALAAQGARKVSENSQDVITSLAVASVLTIIMGHRYSRSGKFMPAGLVSAVSAIMVGYYALLKLNAVPVVDFGRASAL